MSAFRTMTGALSVALAAAVLALPPAAALADGRGKAEGHARAKPAHAQSARLTQSARNPGKGTACPPGLARKDPACIPPGQAHKADAAGVGDRIDLGRVHVVTEPGRYGLGLPPEGAVYVVVGGRLMRVNERTGQILSIIRLVDAILD